MDTKTIIIEALIKLESKLRSSGKIDTAAFFAKMQINIENESNNARLRLLLKELCSSASITQYASFSYEEEKLFDECFQKANNLLSTISRVD